MEVFLTVFWYGASGLTSLIFLALGSGILRWTVREITGRNQREEERKELVTKYEEERQAIEGSSK